MTFDDGPDLRWTPDVLSELAAVRATATFFVISARAAAHPDLIESILSGGHEIGLHCSRHLRHTRTPRAVIEDDTAEALTTLRSFGVLPSKWRLPWGQPAAWTAAIAAHHGLAITGWTADTHDWRGDTAPTMLEAIDHAISDGAIVLMHDGLGPGAQRGGCLETVRLIAPLVATIRARHCEPTLVAAAGQDVPACR
jgi:peptidoglycan/xylan/chitin deacetylase (PgdA/CDA1 family)